MCSRFIVSSDHGHLHVELVLDVVNNLESFIFSKVGFFKSDYQTECTVDDQNQGGLSLEF